MVIYTISLAATEISTDSPEPVLDLSAVEAATSAEVIEGELNGDAKLRWDIDRLIYQGDVYSNSWLVMADSIDDDAIDVDYHAGDTLRAIVACPDSTVRVFRSNDNGETWAEVHYFYFTSGGASEPHIVHGDTTYHVFCRYNSTIDDIFARALTTVDDNTISGANYFLSGDSMALNYSVCTDRRTNDDYTVFLVYHIDRGGRNEDQVYFTSTSDQGQNWSTPDRIQVSGSGFPDITYGNDQILYLTYMALIGADNYNIYTRRSLDFGSNWDSSILIESDSFPKMGPQNAAAYDGSGNVWSIWSKQNLDNANDDWGLRWSWSHDSSATWSSPAWVNSFVNYQELLPSIAVYDAYGSTSNVPYVSFVKSYYDWSGDVTVRSFNWDTSDSSWTDDTTYADTTTIATRPIQAFVEGGPAIAYVGANSENVYFDSWDNSAGIDDGDDVVSNDKIECSLDECIVIGSATLTYTLPADADVNVSLVNVLGQVVATLDNGARAGGAHAISVSTENLAQGVYYIVVEAAGLKGITKATVIK
jgi:hypothetical protein